MKIGLAVVVSSFLAPCIPAWASPVTGRIVDGNQKPVAGAVVRVSVLRENSAPPQNLTTDENGAFTAEIPDTERPKVEGVTLSLAQLRVVAPGLALAQFTWKTPDETFTLARGQSWGGAVLDDDQKPLAGVRVRVIGFRVDGEETYFGTDGPSAQTDAGGRWKIDNVPLRGSARVRLSDARYQSQSFDLPLSKAAAPLFAHLGATVSGRLLKPDGTPIAGGRVGSGGVEEVRTDEEGRFTLSGFAPGDAHLNFPNFRASFGKFAPADDFIVLPQRVEALKAGETRDIGDWKAQTGTLVSGLVVVERPGYVGAARPAIEREGAVLLVADFVLKRRGARFVGRVVDAQGKPVAAAWVTPLELEAVEPVKSAADGTFVLLDLPAGDFTLLAARDRLSATQKTNASAQGVELRLAPPAPIDTQALAQKWIERGGWVSEADFNSGLSIELMEQLALRGSKAQPVEARTAQILARFLAFAARHRPQWTRQNAARLLAMLPDGASKKAAEADIAILRATSNDVADQKSAQAWLEREKADFGRTEATVTHYLAMARVARALKLPYVNDFLDSARQSSHQFPYETRLSNARKWGAEVAPRGETAFTAFIEGWDELTLFAAWDGAVRGFADAGDIGAARRAVETLEILAKHPARCERRWWPPQLSGAAEIGN